MKSTETVVQAGIALTDSSSILDVTAAAAAVVVVVVVVVWAQMCCEVDIGSVHLPKEAIGRALLVMMALLELQAEMVQTAT